jgi:STE24 endopeptidase
MTARRIGRLATVFLFAAAWLAAAVYLYRTSVPSNIDLGGLDVRHYFTQRELDRATRYQRLLTILWGFHFVVTVLVLVVLARRAPRWSRTIGLGRVGTGIVIGMIVLVTLWFVSLPFGVVEQWWRARHDLAPEDYVSWIFEPWATLGLEAVFALATIAIVLGLAGRLGERWWYVGAPIFLVLAATFAFLFGYAAAIGTKAPNSPYLTRADVRSLERRQNVTGTPVHVEDVGNVTTQANAFASGFGPSTNVVIWSTMLDGRFTRDQVRVVLAHELGHVAHRHVLKSLGWSALLILPFAWFVTLVARRRGGIADPAAIPYALLALVVIGFVATPIENLVSRRYEAEADWAALKTTKDAASARKLFENFQRSSLIVPDPSTLEYLWLENHPTIAQRIAMAQAWARRARSP